MSLDEMDQVQVLLPHETLKKETVELLRQNRRLRLPEKRGSRPVRTIHVGRWWRISLILRALTRTDGNNPPHLHSSTRTTGFPKTRIRAHFQVRPDSSSNQPDSAGVRVGRGCSRRQIQAGFPGPAGPRRREPSCAGERTAIGPSVGVSFRADLPLKDALIRKNRTTCPMMASAARPGRDCGRLRELGTG